MTTYVVLLPGNEDSWESASEEHRSATYAQHGEFARMLGERGHTITGGAELRHSRETRVVRRADDLDDLLEVCAVLADAEGAVEVRAAVGGADGPTS